MAQAKSKKGASTQEHLPFTAVFQDTLILKDGNYRQILLVSSINFGLKSEEEQNAILYAYQSFLNSLTFPVQILTQSRQIDLSDYVTSLKQKTYQQRNELIRYQTQEYIDFVGRLIQVANIMDKKFFIVIPHIKTDVKTGLFAPKHGYLQVSLQEFEKIKIDLQQKADVVSQGLATLGLKTVKLTTEQIIELLYASYNITQSLRKKVQNSEELAESTVIQQTESGETISKEKEAGTTEQVQPTPGQAPPPAQSPTGNVKVPINQS